MSSKDTGLKDTGLNETGLKASAIATQEDASRELRTFFLLTFGITFGFQLPGVLAQAGILPGGVEPYMLPVMLGVLGPMLAAWIVTQRSEGKVGVKHLFRSLVSPQCSAVWLLGALVFSGVILSVGLVVARQFGADTKLLYLPSPPGLVVVAVIISIGEEVGWRGFALPRMAKKWGLLRASARLGVPWALWHIPMFMGQGVPLSLYPMMLVYLVFGSVVFGWFYARTKGSLLVAVLLHLGAHLNNSHQALPGNTTPAVVHTLSFVVAALVLVLFDSRTFRTPGSTAP